MNDKYEFLSLYEESPTFENMEGYIYLELLPKLVKLRNENKLFHNLASYVTIQDEKLSYIGDLDLEGRVTGWGAAGDYNGSSLVGTFLDNKPEGIIVTRYRQQV